MSIRLEQFARITLGQLPTPIEPLDRLSAASGGPRIWVKRDDQTGLASGGNKVRKLEFLLGDAIEQKADTLVTVGGVQSNHARQTAAAAARLGLGCDLLLKDSVAWPEKAYQYSGNVLLDRLFGARLHRVARDASLDDATAECVNSLQKAGRRPYLIPLGGSSPIGVLGYVAATLEAIEQLDAAAIPVDTIVVATGSGGTHAGIVAGLAALARDVRVIGVSVSGDRATAESRVAQLARQVCELIGCAPPEDRAIEVRDEFVGDGYGLPTAGMIDAVTKLAQLEGLLIDPVYTGKAMAGLLTIIAHRQLAADQNTLFWHTGGTPALYAYTDCFAPGQGTSAVG